MSGIEYFDVTLSDFPPQEEESDTVGKNDEMDLETFAGENSEITLTLLG